LNKTIPDLNVVPNGVSAANLFFEVARQISAGNFNGESERIAGDALLSLFAGTSLTLNIIQRLNPTGLAYDPAKTYTLYDYLDVPYQGAHYAYIGDAPSAGNAPPNLSYWVLIAKDGEGGGIGWDEYNASATLAANTGAIADSPNPIKFTLPSGAIGNLISVQGNGSLGTWAVVGGTITLSDSTQNTGIRQLDTDLFAGVDLLCVSPGVWVVRSPFVGIELFTDVPPGTIMLSDTFTSPDNTAIALRFPETGSRWERLVSYSSNGVILNNAAANPTGENDLLLCSDIPLNSGYSLTADFATAAVGAVGFIVRAGAPDSEQGIMVTIANNKVYVDELEGGGGSPISEENFTRPTTGNIVISVASDQIQININSGAYTKTIVNSVYNSNAGVGLKIQQDGNTIDNIQAVAL
jgi:hypothetical protein